MSINSKIYFSSYFTQFLSKLVKVFFNSFLTFFISLKNNSSLIFLTISFIVIIKEKKEFISIFPYSKTSFEKLYSSPLTTKYGVVSCALPNISVKKHKFFLLNK